METITSTKGNIRIPNLPWLTETEECLLDDGTPILLTKREGTTDNENENTPWVEYWLGTELIHRSAHVQLKPQAGAASDIGKF